MVEAEPTNLRWGQTSVVLLTEEVPREPASQPKLICKPTRRANNPAKIRLGLKMAPKIRANSHPIPTNSKATPIRLSLGPVNNPTKASNPANPAKASKLVRASKRNPAKVNNLAKVSSLAKVNRRNLANRAPEIPPSPHPMGRGAILNSLKALATADAAPTATVVTPLLAVTKAATSVAVSAATGIASSMNKARLLLVPLPAMILVNGQIAYAMLKKWLTFPNCATASRSPASALAWPGRNTNVSAKNPIGP